MWATGYRRRFAFGATAALAVLVTTIVTLWNYPGMELLVFHVVWIGLAVIALRTPPPRLHSWALVAVVTVLAVVIEIDDVRSGAEGLETLVKIVLDLVTFVALVMLARRHSRALAVEHQAAVAEQHRNDRQRAFFANASHALRTPITVARGHAELALRDTAGPSVKSDVTVVLDELDRLTRATDRILKLSVVDELDPQRQHPVDVDELVKATVERWRPAADRTWLADARCSGLRILGDAESLIEALDALVDNALGATWPGGAISVRSEIEGGMVVLSVSDDGLGVEGVDPEQLFEPFQQGRHRPWQAGNGTGLGLAIVRAIAVAHGGQATMVSTPGLGATVRITIPCNLYAPKQSAPSGQQQILAL